MVDLVKLRRGWLMPEAGGWGTGHGINLKVGVTVITRGQNHISFFDICRGGGDILAVN
jgi:hypothetical protein